MIKFTKDELARMDAGRRRAVLLYGRDLKAERIVILVERVVYTAAALALLALFVWMCWKAVEL